MIVLPIKTECEIRRTPLVNYGLIGVNMVVFLVLNDLFLGERFIAYRQEHLAFHSGQPALHQFFTYQFLHADAWHLLGNMLFLWVFGNSVNAKMGDLPYLMFYLAGGVFAAWGYATVLSGSFQLVGASGAIAAVTTAYLVLFPRSRVTVLLWLFFFIHFIEVSAMIIIGLKIIVWDNILAPSIGGAGQVAHSAHLAGYLFGFVVSVWMLLFRVLPRDQFDMLAIWKRWKQRREFAAAMKQPGAEEAAQFGGVAKVVTDPASRAREEARFNAVADLRSRIAEALEKNRISDATELYVRLTQLDPKQCLPEKQQLEVARDYYGKQRFAEAAEAFERFVENYPRSSEIGNVTFLLGIIYARDLRQFDHADRLLTRTWESARDEQRREQCLSWLKNVRAALGRPAPEV